MYFEPEHSQSNAKFRLIFAYARMSRQVRPWVSIKGVTGFARITRDFRRRTGFFFSRGETKKAKGGARRYESPAVDSRGVGALGTQNLIKLPGRHISRACVARETAGTLWKSNAYISHFGAAAGSRRAGGTGEGGRRGGRHFVFTHSSIIENWRALSLLSRHSHRFFLFLLYSPFCLIYKEDYFVVLPCRETEQCRCVICIRSLYQIHIFISERRKNIAPLKKVETHNIIQIRVAARPRPNRHKNVYQPCSPQFHAIFFFVAITF